MTNTAKHTPGPWEARGDEIYADPTQYDVLGDAFICETAGNEANARLIAAAPELLAALIELEKVESSPHSETTRYLAREQARAAITKAKGE